MKLLTAANRKALPPLYEWARRDELRMAKGETPADPIAVVKFFTPWSNWTWYATEASAILSDGRRVSLAESANLCGMRRNGRASTLPGANRANRVQSAAPVSKPADCADAVTEDMELDEGQGESKLARGPDALSGLHLPEATEPSPRDEKRVHEAGGRGVGAEAGSLAPTWGDCAPQEFRSNGRPAGEPDVIPSRASSADARNGESVLARPTEEDVEFFGLVAGFETELGYFSLSELASVRGRWGLKIERDRSFTPTPLSKLYELHVDADIDLRRRPT